MTATLLIMPSVSRWAMVYAIFAYRYARPSGLGKAFKEATKLPHFIVASIIVLGIAGGLYPLFGFTGFFVIAGAAAITTGLAFYFKYKFAGLTGDTYGAINEFSGIMVLLVVLILAKTGPGLMG
jgi:adenosylcobinamide-GDP ribazoletransferase